MQLHNPICKTPLITAADLRDMFSGENPLSKTMHLMHQKLVDTELELARVKDIEDKLCPLRACV